MLTHRCTVNIAITCDLCWQVHTLVGAGSGGGDTGGGMDAAGCFDAALSKRPGSGMGSPEANLLKPALARGEHEAQKQRHVKPHVCAKGTCTSHRL